MHCRCYLRKGIVYVPTLARTTAGFHLVVGPVAVVPVSQAAELHEVFREKIAKGNPAVPTPARNDPGDETVMLKPAGVKSWSAFERGAMTWSIGEKDGIYRIQGDKKYPGGGWVPDPEQLVTFPPGTDVDEVIDRMIAILLTAAGQ